MHKGFADLSLTAWVRRPVQTLKLYLKPGGLRHSKSYGYRVIRAYNERVIARHMGGSGNFGNHRLERTDLRPADNTARKCRSDDAFMDESFILAKQSAGEPLGQNAAGSGAAG